MTTPTDSSAPAPRPDPTPAGDRPRGLTSREAAARLARFGPNAVDSGKRFWAARTLLGFLANPLVLILLAASVLSGLLGEVANAALVTLMVLLSISLDFFQVFRSQEAMSKLQALVPATTTVWRDDQLVEIPMREVVPGDLLDLRAGDLIPADARLEAATTLTVDEAAMTGESFPVEKRVGTGPEGCLLAG